MKKRKTAIESKIGFGEVRMVESYTHAGGTALLVLVAACLNVLKFGWAVEILGENAIYIKSFNIWIPQGVHS